MPCRRFQKENRPSWFARDMQIYAQCVDQEWKWLQDEFSTCTSWLSSFRLFKWDPNPCTQSMLDSSSLNPCQEHLHNRDKQQEIETWRYREAKTRPFRPTLGYVLLCCCQSYLLSFTKNYSTWSLLRFNRIDCYFETNFCKDPASVYP